MATKFNDFMAELKREAKASVWAVALAGLALLLARRFFNGTLEPVLLTHILTVTGGYTAALWAGAFGIFFVLGRRFRLLAPDREPDLRAAIVRFSGIAAGLVEG